MNADRYGEDYTNSLLPLLDATNLKQFIKLCRTTVLTHEDLVDVIRCAESGQYDLNHRREIRDLLPEEMEIHREDLAKIDPLNNPSKLIARLSAIFRHPRRLVAHVFWCDDYFRWWILTFNYSEMHRQLSGWSEGPHVHMFSYLSHPEDSPNDYLAQILWSERPRLPHKVHIRFKQMDREDHWRPRPTPRNGAPLKRI